MFPLLARSRRLKAPICIFCHHKIATVLMTKVFKQVSEAHGWKFVGLSGRQTGIPTGADVVLFKHSLIDLSGVQDPFIGVHIIRDPRDVIVSGYQYHRRTREAWCTNEDFSIDPVISFPKVPYSQEHRPEAWKAAYLASLNGKSYQANLLARSPSEGLMFEMENYGTWTISSMRVWNYAHPGVLEMRFEDIMMDFDESFQKIFDHLSFGRRLRSSALDIAARHDLSRKSKEEVREMGHVSSRKTSRWEEFFEEEHKRAFIDRFDTVLIDLGYEGDNAWAAA